MPATASASKLSSYALVAALVFVVAALLLAQGARMEAGATTTMTAGIGALRWGTSYPTGSGYDRYAYVDVGIGDAARAAAQPGTSLVYTSGTSVRDNWGSINTGVPLSEARANGWLLTTASGAYVMNVDYGAYVGDFGSPAYQQRWIQNVTGFLAQTGADGVHIDDVLADAPGLTGGVYPSKYPNQQAWETAQLSFVSAVSTALHAKGYYVLLEASGRRTTATGYANDSAQTENAFFTRLAPLVDGVMSEYWMETPADKVNPTLRTSGTSDWDEHWDEWLSLIDTVQDGGADFFTLMYGSASTTAGVEAMRYARGSFLLDWNGGGGAVMFRTGETADAWNLEWTADVGAPTGDKYRVGVGWRRDFTAGTAIVNPSPSSSQTFALGGTYQRADGASVSTVTLGPGRALVLRGTGIVGVPVNTAAPVISGTAQVGSTLAVTTGTWSSTPTTFAYQWQRCDASGSACAPITGATSSRYQLVTTDAARTLRAVVKASNAAGSGSATSAASGVVASAPQVPVSTALPVISGTAQVGSTLSVSTGSWSGSPTTFAYQWQRCDGSGSGCASVAGATAAGYQPVSADVGRTLRAVVKASNTAGSASATSAVSAVVGAAAQVPVNAALPVISGTAQEGSTLAVSTGTWSGAPTTFAYQWQRCDASGSGCASVAGATSAQYQLASADVGRSVRALVRASNTAGSASATSAPSTVVLAAQTTPLTVSSSIADGATLTGPVSWEATVSGGTPSRVEFWVDGALRWTERDAPYRYNDTGVLDPAALGSGRHTLALKAFASDSRSAETSQTVSVPDSTTPPPAPAPPPPPPAAPEPSTTPFVVKSSIEDGQKLRGTVDWTADVSGGEVDRVEFWIDGKVAWTERMAPYRFAGDGAFDSSPLENGHDHTLGIKAFSTDGRSSSVEVVVKSVGG